MTIETLSARTGVSTRNIRAYQSKGLLPPPETVGRVGYYHAGHEARLGLIHRMQRRGFNLRGIGSLLKEWVAGRSLSALLGFESALVKTWTEDKARSYSRAELLTFLDLPEVSEALLEAAVEMGVLSQAEPGSYQILEPEVFEALAQIVHYGVPVEVAQGTLVEFRDRVQVMANELLEVFCEHVWDPFVAEGMPSSRLPLLTGGLHKLRPLTRRAAMAMFSKAVGVAVENATAARFGSDTAARLRALVGAGKDRHD